ASTSRQVGATLGVAVIGSVLAVGTVSAGGGSEIANQIGGILRNGETVWWIVAGCGVAVVALGILTTGPWARATAVRTARLTAPDLRSQDIEP
ncbi:MAG: MFS transporter, partial [Actinomycetota bacterium]|nr:MFS transporter [Actinomycetota bacterium]